MKHIDLSKPTSQHNPFIVPPGYFDNFTQRMMRNIQQREAFVKHEMPIIRWIPWLGAACCAALMAFFAHTPDALPQHQSGVNTHVASSTTTNNSLNNAEAAFDYFYNTDTKYWAYESDY